MSLFMKTTIPGTNGGIIKHKIKIILNKSQVYQSKIIFTRFVQYFLPHKIWGLFIKKCLLQNLQ